MFEREREMIGARTSCTDENCEGKPQARGLAVRTVKKNESNPINLYNLPSCDVFDHPKVTCQQDNTHNCNGDKVRRSRKPTSKDVKEKRKDFEKAMKHTGDWMG
jgi:hypothetical protein